MSAPDRTYDEIVVGSGAGGAVLAARLSEDPDRTVLLVEAGPDHGSEEALPPALRDPFVSLTDADWGYEATFHGDRVGPYPRGRVLGGSTAVNAAIAIRPSVADLDRWVDAGAPDWGHDAVLPYFRRLESDPAGDGDRHGAHGPVPIQRHPRSTWQPITVGFAGALESAGRLVVEDQNVLDADGGGPTPRNVRGGHRISGATAYLEPARHRPNLTILAEHTVDRVLVENGRAVGVVAVGAGGPRRLTAGRVSLAAGTVSTPAILLRSGIGPARELEALGVPVLLDVPAVGRHLRDHTSVFVPATAEPGIEQDPDDYFAYYHREDDVFLALLALTGRRTLGTFLGDPDLDPVVAIAPGVAHPHSRGSVTLRSRDPLAAPVVDLRLLSDERDRAAMRAAVRLTWELLSGPEMTPLLRALPEDLGRILDDDAALDAFTTSTCGTGYHPVGTARMGAAPGPDVVCDQRGRVHGIDGLRVADASLMPTIVAVPTNLTTFMIGERIAEDLRADTP